MSLDNNPYQRMAVRTFLIEKLRTIAHQKEDRWKTDVSLNGFVPLPSEEPLYLDLSLKANFFRTLLLLSHIPELAYALATQEIEKLKRKNYY
ncbi:MAG TPA: hypothetical protein VD999_00420 [Vitreimonas sp.]|nr:hypothetical protein [Vitreimonas sp.]